MTSRSDADMLHPDQVILSWTVHLAAVYRSKLPVALALILFAAFCAWFVLGPIGSFAVLIALSSSISEFLFPVRYQITPTKAMCKTILKHTELEWSRVKQCYVDDDGIKLSTVGNRSRLEAFRGIYLRFNGNREQVIEAVRFARELCP